MAAFPERARRFAGILLLLLLFGGSGRLRAAEFTLNVHPDRESGIYSAGEKVTWQVDVSGGDRTSLTALPYKVKKDDQVEIGSGTLDLSSGPATVTASRDEPGALILDIFATAAPYTLPVAMGGAVVSPEKIGPSAPAPDDFDAFWQAKLHELAAVPPDPVLEPVSLDGIKGADGMRCDKVTLGNIRGTHARGLLARTVTGDKFPAILLLNSAGVSALDKASVVAQAKPGWLALNISAHDLPVDEADAFYKEQKEGPLKNYYSLGSDDREQSYFLRMFLGCVRGAEYLASRPDWDGKTLLVTGVSQGGLQSLAVAALFPQTTQMAVLVPSGCDNLAPLAAPPRAFGWPYWLSKVGPAGRDMNKVQETAGYFDGLAFAARVRCPSLMGVGLIDIASRPAGVIAAYNAIEAPKKLFILPTSNHYGTGGVQGVYFISFVKWKEALRKDAPLPIP